MTQLQTQKPGILVLRPAEQAKETIELIERQGWHAIHFPTIEIVPANTAGNASLLRHLEQFDWLIFISQNAVNHFIKQLSQQPAEMPRIATVGKATTRAAINAGLHVDVQPAEDFSSEGLLQTSAFQHVDKQNILIVRGNGGRELLADTLTERGASVSYAEVYERRLPDSDYSGLQQSWWTQVSVILATSSQLLDNLITLLGDTFSRQLYETPVVVISPRMQKHAQQLGFNKIWLADGPTNDQMLETIRTNMLSD